MEQQNSKAMTLGSLFDGSGGFPLGGVLAGITPIWSSEIEPFPIRVTTARFPNMKHYGDISTIDGSELEPVDIISFGSPCQNLSVAGKREGLDGDRSSLFYEAIRIVKEMREATNGKYPRYIVWENVPGAFSSNKGEDFKAVLTEICKVKDEQVSISKPAKWENAGRIMGDGYSVAWRLLDAQYWGVPQRRQRIYLVADFDGESAGKILFESEGLSGYSAQGFKSWQNAANGITEGIGETGETDSLMFENHSQDTRYRGPLEVAQTVSSTYGTGGNNQPFVVQTPKTLKVRCGCEGGGKGALVQDNLSATLSTNNDQTLFQPRAYGVCAKNSNSMKSDNPNSGFYEADTSRCLDANGGNPTCNQGGIAVIEGNGSRPSHRGDGYKESDVMYTLNATEQHAVAFAEVHATLSANDGPKGPSSQMMKNPEENFVGEVSYGIGRPAMNQGYNARFSFQIEEEVEPTLVASGASGVAHPRFSSSKASFFTEANEECANTLVATDYKDPPIVNDGDEIDYIVRRLTPTECARLQGFPDWWCDDLGIPDPTDEDIVKWREVFETHAKAIGKTTKPKSDAQIRKWLQNPQSDSAEYKMWGNGVALPNVFFVLAGIKYYSDLSQK
ncbi:DNA cytosine methyltransferase [Clostridium perfringens]|uniref:DNA cytosine methyltransferase n=1 Tax=Clostridium perfringens TaxID=1502 RepID=UPI0018E4CF4E|nr:DNA cytosine methyltransferase [Clostridium perfringens]MBI5994039.1 DNA cytosine methyltransferase [Clostridium perfringens]MBI5999893.1 DNA cytosine methyltransferase [Clostridium perfringens]MDK0567959.1 DNA cytosine methyltransferase [Clostridium perfringens]